MEILKLKDETEVQVDSARNIFHMVSECADEAAAMELCGKFTAGNLEQVSVSYNGTITETYEHLRCASAPARSTGSDGKKVNVTISLRERNDVEVLEDTFRAKLSEKEQEITDLQLAMAEMYEGGTM